MKTAEQRANEALKALQQAVAEALMKKKKLGEYAIINRNGKPYKVSAEELPEIRQSHNAD